MKVLAINSNSTYTLYNKFLALFKMEKYDEALMYCQKVFSIEPNFCYVLNSTKNGIPSLDKKYRKAIECYGDSESMKYFVIDYFDKALSIDANNIKALNCKGYALCIRYEFEEGFKCFDKALSLDPNNAEALFNKGVALLM